MQHQSVFHIDVANYSNICIIKQIWSYVYFE